MRSWKVGSITTGLLLLAIGALWICQLIFDFSMVQLFFNLWPFVCILLGAEVLLLHFFKKEEKLRFNWMSIILLITVCAVTVVFSLGKWIVSETNLSFERVAYDVDRSYTPTSPLTKVAVSIPNHHVNIVGSTDPTIKVSGKLTANLKTKQTLEKSFENSFSMKQIGDILYISTNSGTLEELSNVDGDLYIAIPKQLSVDVSRSLWTTKVENISGKVLGLKQVN